MDDLVQTFNKPPSIATIKGMLKVSIHRSSEVERGAEVVYDVGMKRRKEVNDMATVEKEVKPKAPAKKAAEPKAAKPKAVEPPKGSMKPEALAKELGMDNGKQLRAWLRKNHPRKAEEKNTSWTIPADVVKEARETFKDRGKK